MRKVLTQAAIIDAIQQRSSWTNAISTWLRKDDRMVSIKAVLQPGTLSAQTVNTTA